MCSILGYHNTTLSYQEIVNCNARMSHRGPDNALVKGYQFKGEKLYLAHNRLSIQDLESHANQPMENDRFVMVFNGEIYNHLELRHECNYAFKTHSDTETLLALFLTFGIEKTICKLMGMFAIALFDKQKNKLYLIRDRVGIKPLYWTLQEGEFSFSSELKGFAPHLKNTQSDKALIQFMSFGYIPNGKSYYENIYKLKPAHYLVFDGKNINIERYWDLPKHKIDISYEEAVEEIHGLIKSAINYRLLSDLEVGSFLSGGVDSSLVSAIMQSLSNKSIKTFTIGFEDSAYNEAKYAKEVAKHIGSNHYEYIFGVNDVKKLIDNFDTVYDEPFGDASALPTMLLSKFTKEYVTVALSGDGGDELFLGYDRYFIVDKYYHLFSRLPQFTRDMLSSLFSISGQDKLEKLAYPLRHLTEQNLYSVISTATKPWELEKLFSDDFIHHCYQKPSYLALQEIENFNNSDIFDNYSKIDFSRYLVDDILTKVDRASMGYSLEARVPLLDHRIVEFAYSLPTDIKLQHGPKSILKEVLYKYVPKELINRPKMGFAVPLKHWFRGELKDMLYSKIESMDSRFNQAYLKKLFHEHQKGKNFEYLFWNLMRIR